jgi:2-aminoethylphosphonate-pyruvate transaminase
MTYKLLTPGPLSTTQTVKEAMLVDHCTWDDEYKHITQEIQQRLLDLANTSSHDYAAVLMQGSGSFGVEAVLSSAIAPTDKLLVCTNGAYGDRMVKMAERHSINHVIYHVEADAIPKKSMVERLLAEQPDITHLAMVHSETTSGILNDLDGICRVAKKHNVTIIVDAMSSFGGVTIDVARLKIDFLISSANKCIQGVPGFSFVIAKRKTLEKTKGLARTLSLDLFAQYQTMEKDGKWRFTSPTHTVLAFLQALKELEIEGGIAVRHARYQANQALLQKEMLDLGFTTLIEKHQGPFITSFKYLADGFQFDAFYQYLKAHGYVIYPGKMMPDTFRIGTIGDIYPTDIQDLVLHIEHFVTRVKEFA